ncbi:MAG: ABC transporter ATP-binding protein [Parvularculaceae bacterium]|nr:MAG: ABC transporter ATP-binding protein [Parvularculaceae bacterium]
MLHINDLTFRIEDRVLFDQATAAISDGWKTGFVGRNGAGKSTLLKLIRGEFSPDDGDVSVRKGRRIGSLAQEAPAGDESLIATVLGFDTERSSLLAEAETETDPQRIAEIHTRLADIEAHSAESRAASILAGLGFCAAEQQRPCRSFSGGWRMRVALAGLLFSAPDLLLLDEPTNYLDIEGTIWLESYIRRYPYTVLIVSHDRDFLNRCASHILALENRKLSVHTGDYDTYVRRRAEANAQLIAAKTKQDAERRHMQAFVDRFRYKASKAKQAQSRLKALEKMAVIAEPLEMRTTPFHFGEPKPMAPPIVRMEQAKLGYEPTAPILKDVSLRIDQDDRIVILGANGQGKSTLVKSISSRLAPLSGTVRKHKKLKIAYFAQHQVDELHLNQSAYDHVRALMPDATEAQTRSKTAQLGFGAEKSDTLVRDMSGGEKARLLLGLIAFDGPHMMILDEPTNHLDMDSREALADALNKYPGAVLMITHDAHLASMVGERLWLVNDGSVSNFDGDLEDYRRLVLSLRRELPGDDKPSTVKHLPANARRTAAQTREAIAPLKKQMEANETRLNELNDVLKRLDAALADQDLYAKDVARVMKLQKERSALVKAIEMAEEKWLQAAEDYEAAQN